MTPGFRERLQETGQGGPEANEWLAVSARLRQRNRLNQLSRCKILIALGLLEERLDDEYINSMASIMRTWAHLYLFFPSGSGQGHPRITLN